MTTAAAAEYLSIKPATLRGWVRDGIVPAHRIGGRRTTYRFHRDELDAALGLDLEVARSWGFSDDQLEGEVAS